MSGSDYRAAPLTVSCELSCCAMAIVTKEDYVTHGQDNSIAPVLANQVQTVALSVVARVHARLLVSLLLLSPH